MKYLILILTLTLFGCFHTHDDTNNLRVNELQTEIVKIKKQIKVLTKKVKRTRVSRK